MKKLSALVIFSIVLMPLLSGCKENNEKVKESTEAEKETVDADENENWIVLFDGTSTEGWRGYKKEHFPEAWKIADGAIQCIGSGRGEAGNKDGGDIIFDQKFKNFTLSLEWKISEGGNSGIFYLGQEDLDYVWKTAPEMQILDNDKHPDAKLGVDGNRKSGSLYDLIPAKPQNAKAVGEWNQVEITVYNGTVIHKQNGVNVVEYHLWTPEWNAMVAESKFPSLNADWADVANEGYIGLQDHGDDVWFRNIKIKEL